MSKGNPYKHHSPMHKRSGKALMKQAAKKGGKRRSKR